MRLPWKRPVGRHIRAGDHAMTMGNWHGAVSAYANVIAHQPANAAIWTQYGHALKELMRWREAREAYARAIEANPDDLEARLHLGHILIEQGDSAEGSRVLAELLRRDPSQQAAYATLIGVGGRKLLPDNFQRRSYHEGLAGIVDSLRQTDRKIDDWVDRSTYPLSNYDAFRHDFPIKPPPGPTPSQPSIMVVVDAKGITPAFLRSTLQSLIDQEDGEWDAMIVATPTVADHPVASIAAIDPRIRFASGAANHTDGAEYILEISAGTILHRHAIGWLRFAANRTGSGALWCDHDYAVQHWRDAIRYERPCLWGIFDADLVAQTWSPPAAVLIKKTLLDALAPREDPAERRRAMLLAAGKVGPVAHLSRILASILRLPENAERAPPGPESVRRWSTDPEGSPPLPSVISDSTIRLIERRDRPAVSIAPLLQKDEQIQIIIPTRDSPDLLEKAIETIMATAARPARIEFTLVDNRSLLPETARCLAKLRSHFGATVMPFDEPFNWSRINNMAADHSTAPNIVFANNDIEMLTPGWDDLLLGYLQRTDIGLVGARLLYPDGAVQHAGMIFGMGEGPPVHDGVHSAIPDPGPQDRFDLTHAVPAVTGAFMAIRRRLFDQVDRFDEAGLAIAYNDIDLCLRVRQAGLRILYAPAIELIHHESKTRGLNDNRAKIAWDQGELATLYARWGEAMIDDSSYSPHWSRKRLYDGFRDPTMRQILRHLDRSAEPNPWLVGPKDDTDAP